MYRLFALVVTAFAAVYVVGAVYFFQQERWAREPSVVSMTAAASARHPEAVLGLLQERFARQRFGDVELSLVHEALEQAPSFYQSPFFLATYHASRLESFGTVRAAYEAALSRYPANGRLHLDYAIWLLKSRTSLAGWRDPEEPGGLRDPSSTAEEHLQQAMALERDLSWRALRALETYGIPPGRWAALTPSDVLSRRHLIDALFRGGHVQVGLELVRDTVEESTDAAMLRRAARLALEGESPELALAAASKWQRLAGSKSGSASRTVDVALLMSRAHESMGNLEASSRVVEEALTHIENRFGPSSRITLDALCAVGNDYSSRGRTFAAESFYTQAVSRSPSYVPALLGLARSLSRSGDLDGAIARYEEILRLEPGHEVARQELKKLLRRASLR